VSYEYDPEYQEAERQTLAYQSRQLQYAIQDMGNTIARELLPVMETTSLMLRAVWSEVHADHVARMSRLRLWWHIITGHRS